MAGDFLGELLKNNSRARVLRVFVFSPEEAHTLPFVAKRAGVSPGAAAKEIKELEKLGVLKKGKVAITLANKSKRKIKGKQKEYTWVFDEEFKYARALSVFVHEIAPVQYQNIIDSLKRTGKVTMIILSGSFMGDTTRPADMLVVADAFFEKRLERVIKTLEPKFGREIRYASFSTPEFRYRLTIQDRLLRDTLDYPHLVLLDKQHIL